MCAFVMFSTTLFTSIFKYKTEYGPKCYNKFKCYSLLSFWKKFFCLLKSKVLRRGSLYQAYSSLPEDGWPKWILPGEDEVTFEEPSLIQSVRGSNYQNLKRILFLCNQLLNILKTSQRKMSSSSISPAEKPSTGFLFSSTNCLRSNKAA